MWASPGKGGGQRPGVCGPLPSILGGLEHPQTSSHSCRGGGVTPPVSPPWSGRGSCPFPGIGVSTEQFLFHPPLHLRALLFYVGFDVLWCLMTGLRPFALQSASVGRTCSASVFPKVLSPGSTANPGEPGFGPQHGGLREVPGGVVTIPRLGWGSCPEAGREASPPCYSRFTPRWGLAPGVTPATLSDADPLMKTRPCSKTTVAITDACAPGGVRTRLMDHPPRAPE